MLAFWAEFLSVRVYVVFLQSVVSDFGFCFQKSFQIIVFTGFGSLVVVFFKDFITRMLDPYYFIK